LKAKDSSAAPRNDMSLLTSTIMIDMIFTLCYYKFAAYERSVFS
jgi:hypothetical protein